MPTLKQPAAQAAPARKAAALKAANKKKTRASSALRKVIEAENVKARVRADAFTEEQEEQEQETPIRLLSKRQVLARVPVTYPTLWAWMRAGKFPRARDFNGKTGWLEAEINAWITALPLRQLKGDEEASHAS